MLRRTLTTLVLGVLLPGLLRANDAPKGTDQWLDGDWEAVSAVRDGKELPPPPEGKYVLTIKGDALTVKIGDIAHTGRVAVNAGKKPRTIDITPEDGPDKGRTMRAVYEIKGDELRICGAEAGKERPTKLASTEGSGWTLMTLKRVKP